MKHLEALVLVVVSLSAPLAIAQVEWAGDFTAATFYQYSHVQCGAYDGSGACPYGLQSQNVSTTTGNVSCVSPGVNGCRMQLVSPPTNEFPYQHEYQPKGLALRVRVAHEPNPFDQTAGDNAPSIGSPWGADHRNELSSARDPSTGGAVHYVEGEDRYYGWSSYIPTATELANPPNGSPSYHTMFQLKALGNCGSPYLQIALMPNSGFMPTNYRLTLQGLANYPGNAVELWRDPADVQRGRWYSFILRVKWSNDPAVGRVQFWVNGQLMYTAFRRTLLNYNYASCQQDGSKTGVMPAYLKFGLYRAKEVRSVSALYQHGLRVGREIHDVDPRGLFEGFEHGIPVDWEVAGQWRHRSAAQACSPGVNGAGMAYNYDVGGVCAYSGAGVLRTKPFRTPSGGGLIVFKHRSQTEQVYGYDVRTVRVVSPGVNGGSPTVIRQYCGPKGGARSFCDDSVNGEGSWIWEYVGIPATYGGRNDVRLEFEFDSVDGLNNSGAGWLIDEVTLSGAYPR